MKKIIFILNFIILIAWVGVALADSSSGLAYLRSRQTTDGSIGGSANTAWAVMALAAHGESNGSAVESLRATQTSLATLSSTDIERQILALTAAGQNPRTFAGVDAVAVLKGRISNNQFGSADYANDDIFGHLAFKAAQEPIPAALVTSLVSYQNADGGWGIGVSGGSSTDMTSVALIALEGRVDQSVIAKGLDYIRARQNADGGFATSSGESNLGSTTWVDWMLVELGQSYSDWQKNGLTSRDYIVSQQESNGSWRESVLLTSYALIALGGKGFPVPALALAPTPTPAPSPSSVPTATPTVLPTSTPSPTALPTVSPSPGPTATASPSPTPTPNVTPTPVPTPSPAPTASQTPSPVPSQVSIPTPTPQAQVYYQVPVVTPSPRPAVTSTPRVVAQATVSPGPTTQPSLSPRPTITFSAVPEKDNPASEDVLADIRPHLVFGGLLLGLNTCVTGWEIMRAKRQS